MKKLLAIILCLAMLICALCACKNLNADDGKLQIVVTIFPEYDWLKVLMAEHFEDAEVHMLLDSGTDLHNYQPTAQDIALISNCDLFVYIGGESDEWVEDTLSAAGSKVETLCMIDAVDALEEELSEGMQAVEDEDEEGAKDEHIWLSLRNAQLMVKALCDSLCEVDPQNMDTYQANCKSYCKRLAALNEAYGEMRSAASYDTILVADRFPFRYLAEDYSLDYYAAFPGCAAASDISFETMSFLAEKLKTLHLPAVLIIDGGDPEIAKTVIESAGTNAKVLVLDSCQCVSANKIKAGANYLEIMTSNLEILREALNS
ncbi:MAG: metal ABC transporter substrate-binding protein [Clostridia bacterium]|nr:metal ABC transporter substrate-binding protein [Clostridia bacterium]